MRVQSFKSAFPISDGGYDVNGMPRVTSEFTEGIHDVESIEVEPGMVTITMVFALLGRVHYLTPMGHGHRIVAREKPAPLAKGKSK